MDLADLEAGGVQVLLDRALGQHDRVVGEVEVLPHAVAEVRPHDRDPPSRSGAVAHPLQERGDRLLAEQVLEEVGDEHAAEVLARQLGRHDLRDDQAGSLAGDALLVVDRVDRPALRGRDRVDELATPGGGVEHPLGTPQQLVQHRRDRDPDIVAAALVDPTEAVLIQALVVHDETALARRRGSSCNAHLPGRGRPRRPSEEAGRR